MKLLPYDTELFAIHKRWELEYYELARWIAQSIPFDVALDLGCGNGYLVAELTRYGKTAWGCDLNLDAAKAHMPERAAPYCYVHDVTTKFNCEPVDLVICTEVAEHLTRRQGHRLVANCCRLAKRWIFFTAATPGQGGHNHINEQPHEYWIAKFRRHGWRLNSEMTEKARAVLAVLCPTMSWMGRNAMIFNCLTNRP